MYGKQQLPVQCILHRHQLRTSSGTQEQLQPEPDSGGLLRQYAYQLQGNPVWLLPDEVI